MDKIAKNWFKTLNIFQQESPEDYNLWLINIEYVDYKENEKKIILSVTNKVILDKINKSFKSKLENILKQISNEDIKIEILLRENDNNIFVHKNEIPKNDDYSNVKKIQSNRAYILDINPKFVFEKFIKSPNNELAYSASLIIAQNPGQKYNPFFIYGGVGLGKTHLLQAIANYVIKNKPELKVIYVTAENYLNDFVNSINKKKVDSFRAKYRSSDLLLLDDVQFLEKDNKEKTQEELFNTFNMLHLNNKQIVFACDKPPKDLKKIEERLINRFSWGLVVDIKQPDLETRKKIIQEKMKDAGILDKVSIEVIDFLAENITTNVRDIESAVNKIDSIIKITSKNINIELIENEMRDILTTTRAKGKYLSIEDIKKEIAKYYNINLNDLVSPNRNKFVSLPRQMAMFICQKLLKTTFNQIGKEFGGRDHSTVVLSCKKIEKEIQKNPSIRNDYEELLKRLSEN
ncbi:MAG TPA: chromosomal replication initiator protein DnaA [Spirochaetota bacterium]|nr:chromosomal replication initiator protein DnaA [Spirochaetota bacterium]HOM38203.1 chromosomal replication initiator protein DnaA [Spirochaetota bacterium]HPQ48579.1 chromosomal replication initiator protein DnaA [Spirochaetota bacterium]